MSVKFEPEDFIFLQVDYLGNMILRPIIYTRWALELSETLAKGRSDGTLRISKEAEDLFVPAVFNDAWHSFKVGQYSSAFSSEIFDVLDDLHFEGKLEAIREDLKVILQLLCRLGLPYHDLTRSSGTITESLCLDEQAQVHLKVLGLLV